MLSKEKIAYFKNRLLEVKKETEAKIAEHEGTNPNDATGELADYDNHPADIATEQFEQEREEGLNRIRQEKLAEIHAALERIENGTYGISEKSGKPIPEERLEAEPTARTRVDEV